jgi:hypothetical protein
LRRESTSEPTEQPKAVVDQNDVSSYFENSQAEENVDISRDVRASLRQLSDFDSDEDWKGRLLQ